MILEKYVYRTSMRYALGSETICLFAEVGIWLLLWRLTEVDKVKLLTLFGTRRRYSVSTEREQESVTLVALRRILAVDFL